MVAAGIASLKIIHDNPELHLHLLEKAKNLREEIVRLGYQTTRDNTPIIPLILPVAEKAKSLSLFLEENGIIVPFMNYPSRQEINLVRIAVTASHTSGQTELLLEKLKKWMGKQDAEKS